MKQEVFDFLNDIEKNNNRVWFAENKHRYEDCKENILIDFKNIYNLLAQNDALEPMKVYRIYRDVRFSKDKLPYKTNFSMYAGRLQPFNRGGYYLQIEPGNKSFVGGGFWGPNPEDLLRVRQEIALDDELEQILNETSFKAFYGEMQGESLKTAPKGFDKNHERIDLLRKKQFLFTKSFSDEEVLAKNFDVKVIEAFEKLRPFFDYMTDVLLTNANGERNV
ncbi:DUF2461 domain-containing protein [Flavobacterium sp. I3-2]|uniref:DUF2461 domain-containing protein n=1 Tax=Flavobacterium sp. I3-2 TaxID=2748319 RepID=UPI0015AB0479|nr:DUF2461 domain-containing protein [Flavobacterium sp. I3-2]